MLTALFDSLRKLGLPAAHFAVFGSGPLVVRGIIPAVNDIDVLCRGTAWDFVQSIGVEEYLEQHDVTIFSIDDGHITFGSRWAIGNFDTDMLIDTAELLEGLPFVRLQHVIAYKIISDRPKDREHLRALKNSGYLV